MLLQPVLIGKVGNAQGSYCACAERLLSSTLADEAAPSGNEIKAEVDAVRTAAEEPPLLPPQVTAVKSVLPVLRPRA